MKILHVDTGKGWRGGQQQVWWLMEGLRKLGCEQTLATTAGSPLAARSARAGFPLATLSGSRMAMVQSIKKIAKGFEVLHAHDANAHTLAWLAGASHGTNGNPFLVVSRRVAFPVGFLGRMKYASGDRYIAVSKFCADELGKAGVSPAKISVVFDGVEMPPSVSERGAFRRSHGVSESTMLLGTLTSLSPEKRIAEEIDLLAKLPPSVHLWIGRAAAEPAVEAEAELLAQARSRGVDSRFRVVPIRDNATEFLRALDVFIYLSKLEGLGSAILLAMAHGLPVIANRAGGIPEIVADERTGLLVGEPLEGGLFAAATRLLESVKLRREFGDAGRAFVLANATIDATVEKTLAVYECVLGYKETRLQSRESS